MTDLDDIRARQTRLPANEPWADDYRQALLDIAALLAEVDRLRDALEDMVNQFGYWTESGGGVWTGGLSALESAFDALGWEDPHPLPHRVCDEPGCTREGTIGTPRVVGLPGGEYRRTCGDHVPEGWPER
jgi:hypothetical protein